MSLWVYLEEPEETEHSCICEECDNEHKTYRRRLLFEANITHNLGQMADACGIYQHVWRPEELRIKTASELIEPLHKAISELRLNPEKYQKMNPKNRWASYKTLVDFLILYVNACEAHPTAIIRIWR